jgi:hypothetical protein
MNKQKLSFRVNEREYEFDVESKGFYLGKRECIYDFKICKNLEMLSQGYTIRKFPKDYFYSIKYAITNFISSKIGDPYDFSLEKYHEFVDEKLHKEVINSFRGGTFGFGGIHLKHLGIPYQDFDSYVNNEIDSNLSCVYKKYGFPIKHFWIRLVRPQSGDNNPPHKDVHVKRIKKCVNIYLPLAGSDLNSSLPIIPKSHLESESEYIISDTPSYVNGKKFTVPTIINRKNGINLITPNPKEGEIMIFTPYLIHGGGVNHNKNTTRVSLEMRFFV